MARLPTDLEILEAIYDEYYSAFNSFSNENQNRDSKVYVPIDIRKIAARFEIDPEIIFGRLYFHLNKKYGYSDPDGDKVEFFAVQVGGDHHAVQFPLMASVLAELREQRTKYFRGVWLSIVAILISLASLLLTILTKHSG